MIQVFDPATDEVPGYAKHSSTFKNDERCYETHYVVGDEFDAVRQATILLMEADSIDYDVNFSTEGGVYVGVVAKDHE